VPYKKVTARASARRAANWQICENYTIIKCRNLAKQSLQFFNEFFSHGRLKMILLVSATGLPRRIDNIF
jgi:hypothetical protein